MSAVAAGDKAPKFSLEADNGETLKLTSFKGRKLVLYFYPKDDTPGCTKQAIGFTERLQEFEALGVTVLGVSKDTLEKHRKFREKHKLEVLLASDPEGEFIEAYGSWVEKNMYGKKYMGIERSTFLIDEKGTVQEVWRKVRVPGHVDKVLARVKEL
ncbi:thioredoxin-dependent thiol peroxidase [Parvularcula sp. IMCC14364]|uniref:thioredoxin-dependent thiol peroxidase n=1 Tax=Parvularcula sp. IMCC14364 TaxID=3067902 RepID=UPI0027412A3B|nr:thioredoxin-dependent thiol peroxidase [Parvularcula sp. IMCC14364]